VYWRGCVVGGLVFGVLFLAMAGTLYIGHPRRSTPFRKDPKAWIDVRTRPWILGASVVGFLVAAGGAISHWL
jgi:hypothetical protein